MWHHQTLTLAQVAASLFLHKKRSLYTFFAVVGVVVLLSSCQDKKAANDAPLGAAEPVPVDKGPIARASKLASDLALFAGGRMLSADEAHDKGEALASGSLSVETYVDQLLRAPLGGRFAKDLLISPSDTLKDRHPLASHSILKSEEKGGKKVYHLRGGCAAADAVKVDAWWGEAVWVCPEAYRPEVLGDTHGRTCGASMLAPKDEDVCGCGPGLVFCTRDRQQFDAIQDELQEELLATAAHIVDGDKPIEALFSMNETVRRGNAEALYRRSRVLAGEPVASLFPVKGFDKPELRKRHESVPGQHAGVLSTPLMTYSSDALRGVMRNYYDYLWCTGVAASRVETESVLHIKATNLRVGEGWKELASAPICTDCHARLDYGMQFFWGYPSSTMGVDFSPKLALKGTGEMYNHDIQDPRGQAPLNPAGFAKLVTGEPEFGKCMTKKVVDHVFNGTDVAADFAAVKTTFAEKHTLKAMLKTAMLRYAQKAMASGTPTVADALMARTTAAAPSATITLTPALRAIVDDKCLSCHDKDDDYDLSAAALPRQTLLSMVDHVGSYDMPKTSEGLTDDERQQFLAQGTSLLFADENQRALAFRHFAFQQRAAPVHRMRSLMSVVNARGGDQKTSVRPTSIEGAVAQSQMGMTPSVAAMVAGSALASCKGAHKQAAELQACLLAATAPSALIVGVAAQ